QWTANGVAISTAAGGQGYPQLVGDGTNGAVITYTIYQSGTHTVAQRVNGFGALQWTATGVTMSTVSNQVTQEVVSDGAGGALITWVDLRNGSEDLYAQLINASGVTQWSANGVAISQGGGAKGGQQ